MFKLTEIETAASALANQLSAGIAIREAVWRLSKIQPKHAELWEHIASEISRGHRLSEGLENEWPLQFVSSLKAGEESGTLGEVLRRIQKATELQRDVRKIMGKLIMPAVTMLAGLGVSLFFMVGVIPRMQKALGGGEGSIVFSISNFLVWLLTEHWVVSASVLGLAVLGFITWVSKPDAKDQAIALAENIPQVGPALRKLYFGAWAHTIALLDVAGIPAKQQLQLSLPTLPEVYQEGVALMAEDVEKRGLADAADPDKQAEGDPRTTWPYYIATAYMNAHETGRIDQEMSRVAPILIDEALRDITRLAGIADLFAKLISAILIGMPITAYFTQLSATITKAMS